MLSGTALRVNPLWVLVAVACLLAGVWRQLILAVLVLATHELAHMAVARGYGLQIEAIEVTPFGGIMRISVPLQLDPMVELCVAIAGPLNNLFLLGIGWVITQLRLASGELLAFYLNLNAYMACVNMLPALPLDGGRVCRAYLASRYGHRKATMLMLKVSRSVAAGALLLSVCAGVRYRSVQLAPLVLAVVLMSYAREERFAVGVLLVEALLSKRKVLASRGVLPVEQILVLETVTVSTLASRMQPGCYYMVIVCDQDMRPKGTISEREIVRAILSGRANASIGELL